MPEKTYSILEVAQRLSAELNIRVTEGRLRKYDERDLITINRNKDNSFRQFTEEDITKLKIITVLSELGIMQNSIKSYLDKPDDSQLLLLINERIKTVEYFIIIAKELLRRSI